MVVNGATVHGLLHPEGGHVHVKKRTGDDFEGSCPLHGDCIEGLVSTGALAKRKGCLPNDLPSLSDDDEIWDIAAPSMCSAGSIAKHIEGAGMPIPKDIIYYYKKKRKQ